jgi:hypothetical protein
MKERSNSAFPPPATCDPCGCVFTPGKCEGVPADLSIHAGMCSDMNASTLPFGGPAGWDGACTDGNALPAGAECPPGSGILCAQSVSFAALPPPSGESCTLETDPTPHLTIRVTEWSEGAVACRSNVDPHTCESDQQCVADVRHPWFQCVWQKGKHDICPKNFDEVLPRVMYPKEPIESRDCTACQCGDPEGGACVATLRLFTDGACVSQFHQQTVASLGGDCSPVFPAGLAIGSKAITDRMYMPGSCKASGGEPVGEAKPDDENAVTFCCRRSYVFSE